MQIRELSIPDAYVITPKQFGDDRGTFLEWYRFDTFGDAVGRPLDLRQGNTSVSKRGVVRGIHFADVPRGQAKYVTVAHGAVLDFVIDIRVGSPTFGQWDSVLLDQQDRRAVYLSEGLGHAFVALTDDATVTYLVSDVYNPSAEHAINPLDPEVGLVFPAEAGELLLSAKDTEAPGLSESVAAGLLPTWDATRDYYDSMSKVGS
ncbi:dTDP-4-dehydrorhamnose 3,5-epimerase [Salinibacterium sp. ZJ454]|uniref:dTDP-4-dehydrorhamnose 3,5-epimerase n=1 Tax=Salinibacterium sp. ZJ454 TaxID=2708339 RepID=UPI00141F20ED|nr:dTDP-4-dehydrorhamnose 3,5-epimerase [Salinibacterium sp. ZJ454]